MKVVHGRRLDSSNSFMNAVLPSNSTFFAFDGANSDLARQLYLRAKVGDSVAQLTDFFVPNRVQERLDAGNAVEIWTLGGHSMSDLAIPSVQFQAVGCEETSCPEPNGTTSLSNLYCNGEQMLKAARCVMADFQDPKSIHAAMWITGGNPKVVPVPRARRHAWTDDFSNISYTVLTIHTVDHDNEPAYGGAPQRTRTTGMGH